MKVFAMLLFFQFNTSLLKKIICLFKNKKKITVPKFWTVVYIVTKGFYLKKKKNDTFLRFIEWID